MTTRIDPPSLDPSTPYEVYRRELLMWRVCTDIRKEKQGAAIALSLPRTHKSKIRDKVSEQLSLEDLQQENGFDLLLAFLDKHLKKDDLTDSLEKFEEFEDFSRREGMSISDFIEEFDSLYLKIDKLSIKLPPEILAFKLLRRANITKEEKMLVLTGMNYQTRDTLYEEAKTTFPALNLSLNLSMMCSNS